MRIVVAYLKSLTAGFLELAASSGALRNFAPAQHTAFEPRLGRLAARRANILPCALTASR